MPQTFSVTLPDDACEYLLANARWNGMTPEALLTMWANRMIQLRNVGNAELWAQFYAVGKVPSLCDPPMPEPLTNEELENDALLRLAGAFSGESATLGDDHDGAFADNGPNCPPRVAKHG